MSRQFKMAYSAEAAVSAAKAGQKPKIKITPNKLLRNLTGQAIQNSKLARDATMAKKFMIRLNSGERIPLRTMLLMKNRMSSLHKKIKPLSEFQKLKKDIDAAFLQIARAQVRHERKLKTKKKVRTYGDSMVNRKKKR